MGRWNDSGRGTVSYKGVEMDYQVSEAGRSEWMDMDGGDFGDQENYAEYMGGADSDAGRRAMERAKEEYYRREKNKKQRDANTAGVAANKKAIAAKPDAPQEKPKGPLAIDPVTHSPEISAAQKVANSYMAGLQNQKSPWEQAQADANSSSFGTQNQTDFTAQFNPSGSDDSPQLNQEASDMKNKAQSFADKYKLDLISSGATKGFNQ